MDVKPGKSPRKNKYADKLGSYGIIARTSSDVIDPGEILFIEIYVSGYGIIDSAKLVFYPSPGIIDSDDKDSYVIIDMHKKNEMWVWGARRCRLHEEGNAIGFTGGLYSPEWAAPSVFFDLNETQISTEKRMGGVAPVHINLKTKCKAKAGNHSINFVFTYFNGSHWSTCSSTVQFKIRNFFERNDKVFLILGAIAALSAIIISLKTIICWFI
jgi:hypothetical protein